MSRHMRDNRNAVGFTLVEVLVVVGIIVVLVAILVPAAIKGRAMAERSGTEQLMGAIVTGVTTYENDFDNIPPSAVGGGSGTLFGMNVSALSNWAGGELITQAMVGPASNDGESGKGFRESGSSYGPYVDATDYEIARSNNAFVFMDRWDRAILYYAARRQWQNLWGTGNAKFVRNDNDNLLTSAHGQLDLLNNPRVSEATDQAMRTAPYFLYSLGPDGQANTSDDIFVLGP